MTSKIIKECGTCWEYDIPAGYCGLKEQNGWLWDDVCDSWTWLSPRGRPTKEEYAESKRIYEKLTGPGAKPSWAKNSYGEVHLRVRNSQTKRKPLVLEGTMSGRWILDKPNIEEYKPEKFARPLSSFVTEKLQKKVRARLEPSRYDKNGMFK